MNHLSIHNVVKIEVRRTCEHWKRVKFSTDSHGIGGMDAPLRSLRSLGGKYNKELASSHIISRDPCRIVGSQAHRQVRWGTPP